jgi:hypothetical protein
MPDGLMAMGPVRKSSVPFAAAFAVCFPFAFIFTRYMQDAHHFDSVGLWYTSLVASAFSAAVAGAVAFTLIVVRRRRNRASGGESDERT